MKQSKYDQDLRTEIKRVTIVCTLALIILILLLVKVIYY